MPDPRPFLRALIVTCPNSRAALARSRYESGGKRRQLAAVRRITAARPRPTNSRLRVNTARRRNASTVSAGRQIARRSSKSAVTTAHEVTKGHVYRRQIVECANAHREDRLCSRGGFVATRWTSAGCKSPSGRRPLPPEASRRIRRASLVRLKKSRGRGHQQRSAIVRLINVEY